MSEETVGWIGAPGDPVPADDEADPVPVSPEDTKRRTAAVGRIAVALVVAWTALVAIPGAVPWAATDDSARAIAFGVAIASIVALVGLALAWLRTDQLGVEGATFGTAAAFAALGLAALEVVNLMILPQDAPYRLMATGVGLLVLIAVALVTVAAVRMSFFEGSRFSSITLVGTAIGIVVVVAYLVMIQTMVNEAGSAEESEWIRLTTLMTGLQTLAFAGLGALLGTAVQGQVTSSVKNELGRADAALGLFETEANDVLQEIRRRAAQAESDTEAVVIDALRQDPGRFRTEAAMRRWIRVQGRRCCRLGRRPRREPRPGRCQRSPDPRRLRIRRRPAPCRLTRGGPQPGASSSRRDRRHPARHRPAAPTRRGT